jgi:peptide/nickel transport system substrate-binding protein
LLIKLGGLLAFAVLVVAACGGTSANNANNTTTGSNALFSGSGVDVRPAPKGGVDSLNAEAGTPKRGGKVTYALQAEDDNGYCLPDAQLDAAGEQVAGSIYDTLTRPTNDGKFVPYLADKVEHSADYLTWTITLRSGIKFSDGSPLTGEVVKNNLDAYRGKNPNHPALLFQFVFSNIKEVKATGPLTVEVDMTKPWKDFDAYLYGSRRLGIIGQAQLDDKANCAKNLIGTGPFVLQSWTVGQRYVLKPNPNYWRKDANGQQLPYLAELDYVPIPDSGAMMNAFSAGSVNAMMTTTADNVLKLRDLSNSGKARVITSVREDELGYLMLNAKKAPFDDQSMRIAATEAIDMGQINRDIGHNLTPLAAQPYAPGNIAYSTDITRIPLNMQDAQKRVKEYADAHGGGKPHLVVTATPDPVTLRTAQVIASYLNTAGFDASVSTIAQAQLIEAAIKGDFQIQTWRNHNGSDPGTQYVWWHSGLPTNFGGINDPIIDCLLDVGRSGDAAGACLKDEKNNTDYNTGLPAGLTPLNQIDPNDEKAVYMAISEEFKKKAWNIWGSYSPWTVGTAQNVHGIFGANNPDGSSPSQALVNGTAVETLWVG